MFPFILSLLVSSALSSAIDGLDCGYPEICMEESLALLQTSIVMQHKDSIENANSIPSNSRFTSSGSFYERVSESLEKPNASEPIINQIKESIQEGTFGSDCTCCPETCNQMSSQLKFVQITKTGGSSVEIWGNSNGFKWGLNWLELDAGVHLGEYRSPPDMEPWHIPPQWFSGNDPYDGYTMFAVVRDPYSRIISEFRCPHFGFMSIDHPGCYKGNYCEGMRAAATVEDLNAWAIEKLKSGAAQPPFKTGHMVPQHFYIYGKNGELLLKPENVIRHETFDADFAALKERYNITGGGPVQKTDESEMKKFNVTDFSAEARQLIEQVYSEDFDRLRYPKL